MSTIMFKLNMHQHNYDHLLYGVLTIGGGNLTLVYQRHLPNSGVR